MKRHSFGDWMRSGRPPRIRNDDSAIGLPPNDIGYIAPGWLRVLREAGYDLARLRQGDRSRVLDAARRRGIEIGVGRALLASGHEA